MKSFAIEDALDAVEMETKRAVSLHGPMKSAHEAYGVILEELDEFWDEVKKKQSLRDKANMKKELIQVAAMAVRAIADLGL